MSQPPLKYYTEQEYLAFEREATEKHEYYKGEIFAMSGGLLTIIILYRLILSAFYAIILKVKLAGRLEMTLDCVFLPTLFILTLIY
jgi:hypothetical protein